MATWGDIVELAARYPGVEEGISYGEPSLKVGKSLLTRWRKADNSLVLNGVPADERELLIEADRHVFFVEPHYHHYPIVLVRLSEVKASNLQTFLERRWRDIATKRVIKAYEDQSDR